jgi:two-component system, cell cycle response regulator DivK
MDSPRRNPLVLLVDDYEDAREMYSEWLRFKGYRVIVAEDGTTALAQARQHSPDVILMDVRMPDMTGTEVAAILRGELQFARTPIAALTAHALDEEVAALRRAGFDTVLSKPMLPDELLAEIERLLAGSL